MRSSTLILTLATTTLALNDIIAPSTIQAGQDFQITFSNPNTSDTYRVYLAATLADNSIGPTCYLLNTTTLTPNQPLTLTIPPSVGPSGNYYSIAITDLTSPNSNSGAAATPSYSNQFNLTAANGTYTSYENSLHGAPFWSADALPCTSYSCARTCAMDFYPDDLSQQSAFDQMKMCILECDGVTPAANQTVPPADADADAVASGTASSSSTSTSSSGGDASSTESGAAATSSSAASAWTDRKVFTAATAAGVAGFGALAFLL